MVDMVFEDRNLVKVAQFERVMSPAMGAEW